LGCLYLFCRYVVAAQEVLSKEKPYDQQYKGMISAMGSSLNIRVAPANVSRALRFLDSLCKALIVLGHLP
jgi:hypothetical protein